MSDFAVAKAQVAERRLIQSLQNIADGSARMAASAPDLVWAGSKVCGCTVAIDATGHGDPPLADCDYSAEHLLWTLMSLADARALIDVCDHKDGEQ